MQILDRNRVSQAKRAFSTRRVPPEAIKTLITDDCAPRPGDLLLAQVLKLGSHQKLESPDGRRVGLNPGDEIIVAYGNRYAPDQYEAIVPDSLAPCDLVAAGGVASKALSWHDRLSGPTQIAPIGLIACAQGNRLNLADFALAQASGPMPNHIFAVFGTSMNAGKTITAASLVSGFRAAGHHVGAAKITGTAAGGDPWLMRDCGAAEVVDFTDAGFASTFNVDPSHISHATENLLRRLGEAGCTVAIVEIADGLYQMETAALARMQSVRSMLTGTFFAAGDSMGAVSGVAYLVALGHRVLGISGALTRSPLAIRETCRASNVPVYRPDDLVKPETVRAWLTMTEQERAVAVG